MLVDDYSLKRVKKKAIGGLVSSTLKGTFLHFNTSEDYQAADFKEIVAKEASGIVDVENLQEANRFVVLSFGDLKNYLYHYR